jgi:S-adenosylmethionine:tRNA ribosyltransferase-isomerase
MGLTLDDFDYVLPEGTIAQKPAEPRDSSKLLVVDRQSSLISHRIFKDLPDLLHPGDVLILNQTKVFPARLLGKKKTGGKVELLLLSQQGSSEYQALCKPGLNQGQTILFDDETEAEVITVFETGEVTIHFSQSGTNLLTFIERHGLTPLPPYIHSMLSEPELREKYQTVYAVDPGSAAAPTAGLHFTDHLLEQLKYRGIQIETLTLHVGLGTFQRLRETVVADNHLHEETYSITPDFLERLNEAKSQGRRIIAVGTTAARALESVTQTTVKESTPQKTALFIYPPYQFQMIDGLITNFHLPQSSLLMMVAAFVSKPQTPMAFSRFNSSLLGKAYAEALDRNYRFFSFGDAMFIS